MAHLVVLSVFCALPFTEAAEPLTITAPVSRVVYQRSPENVAKFQVSGIAPAEATQVEARVLPRREGQGIIGDWTVLALDRSCAAFTGELLVAGGWYDLEVRALDRTLAFATNRVERVGVGEVFIVVGHSVAAGQDLNLEGATDDRVNAISLDAQTDAYQGYLKTGDPRFLPAPVFTHYGTGVRPAPFGNGSYFWSKFGELVAQEQNVPVLIYNAAFGGTSLEHWAKSAQGQLFEHSFVKASIRMPYVNLLNTLKKYIPLTGLRAILADQGQNDWPEKASAVVARNYQAWIDQARADLGFAQLAVVVNRQTPFRRDAPIRTAQEQIIQQPQCFPGPDYDTLDADDRPDGIHLSLQGQAHAARLWAEALDHRFFASATPWQPIPASSFKSGPWQKARLRTVPVSRVEIADSFWAPKLEVYREQTIPHSWQYMQWELRALRKAAGQPVTGDLNGTWGEANLYKFLETVAYSLAQQRDPKLEQRADEVIELLAAGQQQDGYLHVYVTNNKKVPWDPGFLDGSHDGYVLGHMIEAAIEYYGATGKRRFLEIACRAADQAYNHFLGRAGQPGFCGHAEAEMALMELYRVTHEARYLELAKAFVEWRGRGKVKPFSETPRAYFQDAVPVREQLTLAGHAVRALFFATGVADLALETGDPDYRLAAHRFWDSTVHRRMTITGSTGPRQEHEAFGEDYELPNNGYYESCAACGLADFAQRMFLLEGRAECADVLERVLYNAVLHGMELSGTNSYYQNPLSDHDRPRYNSWVCCPPNLSRTLLQAGRYAFAQSGEELYVNLFIGGTWRAELACGPVALRIATDYPWDGQVRIVLEPEHAAEFALNIRQPGWCARAELRVNGQPGPLGALQGNGYLRLKRTWQAHDHVEITFDMPVRRMVAHPNIKDCQDKVALQRGPLIYGFEGIDNAGLAQIALDDDPEFEIEYRPDWLGGVAVIKGRTAGGQPFLAIPFYALANRGKSAQEVWVTQRDLKRDSSWWMGRLYRPREEMAPARAEP